jgi:hypothetical protein
MHMQEKNVKRYRHGFREVLESAEQHTLARVNRQKKEEDEKQTQNADLYASLNSQNADEGAYYRHLHVHGHKFTDMNRRVSTHTHTHRERERARQT